MPTCCNPNCDAVFTFGNNPAPRWTGDGYKCCDTCNQLVIKARMDLNNILRSREDPLGGAQAAMAFYMSNLYSIEDELVARTLSRDTATKKLEVAKRCITTLGETAKKATEMVEAVKEEACVAPMIDRIMDDAAADLQVEVDKSTALAAELAEKTEVARVGIRISSNFVVGLIATSLQEQEQSDSWDDWRVGAPDSIGDDYHFNMAIPTTPPHQATPQEIADDDQTALCMISTEINKMCRIRKNRTNTGITIGFGTCNDPNCLWKHLAISDGHAPAGAANVIHAIN